MTSRSVLRCLTPRLPALSVGSVFRSMPLGRIVGRPVTPLSLAISARRSATVCFNSAFSASRRSVRASRSPRDRPERGIFSGTDMPATNRVRKERMQPHSISYLPGFLPQVHGHRPSPWNRWGRIRRSGRSRSYSLANGDLGCSRISPHEAVLTASQLWKTLLRGMKGYQYVGLRSVPLFPESLPWPWARRFPVEQERQAACPAIGSNPEPRDCQRHQGD